MQWLLPSIIIALLSFTGSAGAVPPAPSRCNTAFGKELKLTDCSIAWRQLFEHLFHQPVGHRFNEVQFSAPRRFTFHDPDINHRLPRSSAMETCAVGIGIVKSHRPTVISSWKWLADTMRDLIRECVLEGEQGSGGSHRENGIVFVVAEPRTIELKLASGN